ncbi:hypothetical protein [Prosthecobacter sp.]|jgi:hypothetical protein|uniref:hypothetical protein n=1 Tax=Prosthecobacter sp. TaxID=1965333 RepID=UPI003783EFD3
MSEAIKRYVLGYDPGGDGNHGIALLEVAEQDQRWMPVQLYAEVRSTVADVIHFVHERVGQRGVIVASGIDTLTAWSTKTSGWRPADVRLRSYEDYAPVTHSVKSPNGLRGAMSINGAILLHWLKGRDDHGGIITESHPKVTFFALTCLNGAPSLHPWATRDRRGVLRASKQQADDFLRGWLGMASLAGFGEATTDDGFDACIGCVAALKGLNREWTHDLHQPDDPEVVHPFGQTHYWWPHPL